MAAPHSGATGGGLRGGAGAAPEGPSRKGLPVASGFLKVSISFATSARAFLKPLMPREGLPSLAPRHTRLSASSGRPDWRKNLTASPPLTTPSLSMSAILNASVSAT
eukprot:643789-Prorocentrum_minimum.AAC.2